MPKFITKHTGKQVLGASPKRLEDLKNWIYLEVEDAISSRRQWEASIRDSLRMYEGVPRLESRDIPIENAPNVEITIGAIAADTVYAQAFDLIFTASPLVTIRPKPNSKEDKQIIETANDMQKMANHFASAPEVNVKEAVDNSLLDDVQIGTGCIYVPFVEKTYKTRSALILNSAPRFISIPPEDVIVPGGTSQCKEDVPFLGLRFYHTLNDLMDSARTNGWNLDGIQPIGSKNWVRTRRETLGRHIEGSERKGHLFDIIDVHCYFDIDGDGYDEDLYVVYNHSGRQILYYSFNSADRRPLEKMVYQKRAHMFYGMGVLEMLKNFEDKLTDVHNYSTLNILLANSRVWLGTEALPESLKLWPGKYIQSSSIDDLKPLQMADVYNSIWQEQAVLMQLANQRVGINEVSQGNQIPSRTPGITAMSFLQQVSKRFAPAFDSMRTCVGNSFAQCFYRLQERILSGDKRAEAMIFKVVGYESGMRIINLLMNESFDEHVDIEITASSASINREADRQNAIMLTNIVGQYYQRTLELVTIASNPQTPPEVRQIANKIAEAAGEVIKRTVRTFDQVRDPETFVIEVADEINRLEEMGGSPQIALQQLMGAIVQSSQGQPLELGV